MDGVTTKTSVESCLPPKTKLMKRKSLSDFITDKRIAVAIQKEITEIDYILKSLSTPRKKNSNPSDQLTVTVEINGDPDTSKVQKSTSPENSELLINSGNENDLTSKNNISEITDEKQNTSEVIIDDIEDIGEEINLPSKI